MKVSNKGQNSSGWGGENIDLYLIHVHELDGRSVSLMAGCYMSVSCYEIALA